MIQESILKCALITLILYYIIETKNKIPKVVHVRSKHCCMLQVCPRIKTETSGFHWRGSLWKQPHFVQDVQDTKEGVCASS